MKKTNQLNSQQIRMLANRYVASYETHAFVYRKVREQLIERLSAIKLKPGRILILGCATGEICQAVREAFGKIEIVGLDCAQPRLSQAKQSPKKSADYWVANWSESLSFANEAFDLVISNLMLPWCQNLASVFTQIQRVLTAEGAFFFTTFGPDTLQELRQAWAVVDSSPHVHTFLDMHDIGDRLLASGLADPVMDVESVMIHYQSSEQLFNDLKLTGSGNALKFRAGVCCSPGRFKRFQQGLEQNRNNQNKLPITYEIVHGHAWKGEPTLINEAGEFHISLETLKQQLK